MKTKLLLSIVLSLLTLPETLSQEIATPDMKPAAEIEAKKAPATLEEAHAELTEWFSKEELAQIDAMQTKDDMLAEFFESRYEIESLWGLTRDSSLAKALQAKGFVTAQEKSGIIFETFWMKRKGKEVKIKELAADYKAYREENEWPPDTAIDPDDQSAINWNTSLLAEGRPHRRIYLGESDQTGRLLAYEHTKGVYVPDKELLQMLEEVENMLLKHANQLKNAGQSKPALCEAE